MGRVITEPPATARAPGIRRVSSTPRTQHRTQHSRDTTGSAVVRAVADLSLVVALGVVVIAARSQFLHRGRTPLA